MEITGLGSSIQLPETKLTDDQKKSLEEILAKYDPDNMSEDDRRAMLQEMQDAGIPRSQDTMDMLRAAGFKPAKKTDSAQVPSLLDSAQDQTGNQTGELWSVYQQFQSGEITEAEFLSQIKIGIASGSLINYIS